MKKWSDLAGMLLGQLAGVWFALAFAVIIFVAPTKLICWAIDWFWHLF